MKMVVCGVFDSAIQAFGGSPLTFRARGEAIRAFMDELQRPDSPMSKHPTDFELRWLAVFDPVSGQFFEPDGGPQVLMRGADAAAAGGGAHASQGQLSLG